MTLKPASDTTFAQIVPDKDDQRVIYNEVSRILGILPLAEKSLDSSVVVHTPSNKV
jgi:hypothetical protein